jgi:outer membrane protein assembly factor BamB
VIAPKGQQVAFQFDWGDNAKSAWSAFLDDTAVFSDTHSFTEDGDYQIRARVKVGSRASGLSDPLAVTVRVGEGGILWSFGYESPEEDSALFTLNTFALGSDGTAFIGCDLGAVIGRRPSGSLWKYFGELDDAYYAAAVVADDGTIYIGRSNDTVYALNPDGTPRWKFNAGSEVNGTGALGEDGTFYCQSEDSVFALRPDGSRLWPSAVYTQGGNAAPAIGPDGSVFVANQVGQIYKIDPSNGSLKWPTPYNLSTQPIVASMAIDTSRNALYAADDQGTFASIDLSGSGNWPLAIGADPSSPVIGPDGVVYIGGGGKLWAVNPDGSTKWTFTPSLAGVVSTPALSSAGYVYILVTSMKKASTQTAADTMYGVNPDGTRRWATGLGEGTSDSDYPLSAPKIDAEGRIYIGDGLFAWCLVGIGGPAQSPWPVFQHDNRNTGRAR